MAELYSLTLILSDGSAPIVLMYDGERNARAAMKQFSDAPVGEAAEVEFRDDFGSEGSIWADTIAGRLLQNAARALEAGVRRALLQNDANMKATRQAQAKMGAGIVPAGGILPGQFNG